MNTHLSASGATPDTLSVGIIGGTGYTGAELLGILLRHPVFDVVAVTARQQAGTPVAAHWPHLAGEIDLDFVTPDAVSPGDLDLVFCATPHAAAMAIVPSLIEAGVRVVDLSADFRLKDPAAFEAWYGVPHTAPHLMTEAVYGLPEFHREAIASARLVANPGCYPTATLLALAPLAVAGLAPDARIVVDAKSGVSGAGRKASEALLYGQIAENFTPYGLGGHRHHPEIVQGLATIGLTAASLTFVPHLLPMFRGMEVTAYVELDAPIAEVRAAAVEAYLDEPFVHVAAVDGTSPVPSTQTVRASNQCRLAYYEGAPPTIVAVSVIDNLVKGAAGQAVQNANLMYGLPETAGLERLPAAP